MTHEQPARSPPARGGPAAVHQRAPRERRGPRAGDQPQVSATTSSAAKRPRGPLPSRFRWRGEQEVWRVQQPGSSTPSAQRARDPRLLTMAEYVCTNMGRVVWGVRRGGDTALVRRQGENSSREPSQPARITVQKLRVSLRRVQRGWMGCSAGDAHGCVHGDGPVRSWWHLEKSRATGAQRPPSELSPLHAL